MIEDVTECICMMPVQFGLLELFSRSQMSGKLAGIRPKPNAKPVIGAALESSSYSI